LEMLTLASAEAPELAAQEEVATSAATSSPSRKAFFPTDDVAMVN